MTWLHRAIRPSEGSYRSCTACAAALRGEVYQREIPPSAARIMRRGAA
jgi:hypothetical protein